MNNYLDIAEWNYNNVRMYDERFPHHCICEVKNALVTGSFSSQRISNVEL